MSPGEMWGTGYAQGYKDGQANLLAAHCAIDGPYDADVCPICLNSEADGKTGCLACRGTGLRAAGETP